MIKSNLNHFLPYYGRHRRDFITERGGVFGKRGASGKVHNFTVLQQDVLQRRHLAEEDRLR